MFIDKNIDVICGSNQINSYPHSVANALIIEFLNQISNSIFNEKM